MNTTNPLKPMNSNCKTLNWYYKAKNTENPKPTTLDQDKITSETIQTQKKKKFVMFE